MLWNNLLTGVVVAAGYLVGVLLYKMSYEEVLPRAELFAPLRRVSWILAIIFGSVLGYWFSEISSLITFGIVMALSSLASANLPKRRMTWEAIRNGVILYLAFLAIWIPLGI